MSGFEIQAAAAAGIQEAARAVGDGAQATLMRSATPPVNPWDAPSGTTTTQLVWAVAEQYRQDMVDGTLIRAEDRRVMLEYVAPAPTTADRLSIGGTEYAIVSVQIEDKSGVALYYICQCRK